MDGIKGLLQSKTVWAGIVTAGTGLAALAGYTFSVEDQAKLSELLFGLVTVASGLYGIYGRVVATKAIAKK